MVHLVQTLEANPIELGYRIHAFAGSNNVWSVLIDLFGMLPLLFQINDFIWNKCVVFVPLIEFG